MKNMEILIETLYRTTNLVTKEMETPWLYGVDFPLHHAEVHLLEAIKTREGANVSELARYLCMTSGAVSQVTKKLLDKGLIEAYRKTGNRKEVFSRLTALGERICEGHQRHHENMVAVLREFMDRLDEHETSAVYGFLDAVSRGIEEMIEHAEKTV
jgi:DNA-binding MarR family transcriptional regulator